MVICNYNRNKCNWNKGKDAILPGIYISCTLERFSSKKRWRRITSTSCPFAFPSTRLFHWPLLSCLVKEIELHDLLIETESPTACPLELAIFIYTHLKNNYPLTCIMIMSPQRIENWYSKEYDSLTCLGLSGCCLQAFGISIQPVMSCVNMCPTSWKSYFTSLSPFIHLRINLRVNEMHVKHLAKHTHTHTHYCFIG